MKHPLPRFAVPVAVTLGLLAAGFSLRGDPAGEDFFMPHAHCYLFNRNLMRLHGGSDLLIGLAYVTISATLVWLVYRARRELPFHWMMIAFAVFIVACGATHFMELWTLTAEHPRYWLSGWVKAITAVASVTTAIVLPPLIPRVLALLGAARLSAERYGKLERAYGELNERYVEERSRDLAGLVRELAETKKAAEAANRAKDEFLAALSHELRTPLTPVLMLAGEMEKSAEISAAVRRDFAMIRKNVELEARIIDDLLDLTRITRGKLTLRFETVDVHALIEHPLAILRADREAKDITVALNFDAIAHHVSGDAVRLQQVFWNVLKNAIKFTPQGGRIAIRSWNEDGQLRVSVSDTGSGITPEEMPRIFTAFEQGREAAASRFGGLGLGLSITALLVREHRGRIWAESAGRDQGAAFHLELPLVASPAPDQPATPSLASPKARPLRVLLVEDHEDTRGILQRLMTRWGHSIMVAASVSEAREAIAKGTFDLLLSDLGLPDGTGYDVIAAFREKSDAPAVAMSGFGMEADLARTTAAGFAEHVVKPVSADALRDLLTCFAGRGGP
jgi:signal transduction histidine kinase